MFEITDLMLKLAQERSDELNLSAKDIESIDTELGSYQNPDEYKKLNITFYGEPRAQKRHRAASNMSHFYDPSKSFKVYVNESIRNELGNDFKPIATEIYFNAKYYRPYPKSTSRKNSVLMELGVIRPTVKPDLDNYTKLLYDALKNLLYTDDSIIVGDDSQKYFSAKPRVEIEILFRLKK